MSVVSDEFKLIQLESLRDDIKHKLEMFGECEMNTEDKYSSIIHSLIVTLELVRAQIKEMAPPLER